MLPVNGRIELSFDRLLLPLSTVRQTFVLLDALGNVVDPVPTVAYDPVAIVVTVTPAAGSLEVGQPYKLVITTPSNAADVNGLRTIDGAYLSADSPSTLGFMAADPLAAPVTTTPVIDYCRDIAPVISNANGALERCPGCHGAPDSFDGLLLDTPAHIEATALGQVAGTPCSSPCAAIGSNSGPTVLSQPPLLFFAEDVPIIDPGPGPSGFTAFVDGGPPIASGNPGHSWLLYKVLMAPPAACEPNPGLGYPSCDGGAPVTDAGPVSVFGVPASISSLYEVTCSDAGAPCPQPLSDAERARLASLIPGREMPFPNGNATLTDQSLALTVPELELLSLWIAQGAPMPASCQAP